MQKKGYYFFKYSLPTLHITNEIFYYEIPLTVKNSEYQVNVHIPVTQFFTCLLLSSSNNLSYPIKHLSLITKSFPLPAFPNL